MRSTPIARLCPLVLVLLAACSDDAPPTASASGDADPVASVATATLPTRRWSDPAAWPGGRVPQAGEVATIPAGTSLLLDTATAPLAGLAIEGRLVADPAKDVAITARYVMVHGANAALEIGSEGAPHARRATITLTGTASDPDVMGMGTKVLGVMAGGRLDLHGASAAKTAWTRLASDAQPGATSIELAESVNWAAGDTIVLAPSGFAPEEGEVAAIASVSGTRVTLAAPLRHTHLGTVQTIEGRAVDMRAEVGLLSRNVVVRGDATSATTRFGGHVMVMGGGARARVSGVAFRELGQERRIGRYAFHWHLVGAANGGYVRRSAIHTSFTRGIVVHGTNGARVEDVVGYEAHSHMFVPGEDGTETDNVFRRNLGILVRRLPDARRLPHPGAGLEGRRTQDEHRPSVFWAARPTHVLEGNAAAGATAGNGFHVAFDGLVEDPASLRITFRDNVAHSNRSVLQGGIDRYPPETHGHGLFVGEFTQGDNAVPAPTLRFERFTAYKNGLSGAWLEERSHVLSDAVLSDNGTGAILFQSTIERALIVGQSANRLGTPPTISDFAIAGGIHVVEGFLGHEKKPVIRDVVVVDQRDGALAILEPWTASGTRVERLRTVRTRPIVGRDAWTGAVHDVDGSLLGAGPSLVFPERSVLAFGAGCTANAALAMRACPLTTPVARFSIHALLDGTRLPAALSLVRDDGAQSVMDYPSYEEPRHRFEQLASGRRYTLRGTLPRVVQLHPEDWQGATAGRVIDLVLPATHPFLVGWRDADGDPVIDRTRPLRRAATLAEAQAAPGRAFWVDPAGGAVHVRIDGATALVHACTTATCR